MLLACACGLVLLLSAGVADRAWAVPEDFENASLQQLTDWIVEGGTTAEVRRRCAEQLVSDVIARERGAIQAVVSMLDADRPTHAREAVLRAISRADRADEVTLLADATLAMRQ
ncbi:MAG: hypothetical protein ACPGYV_14405, partial [Phycisphaeraceae bacterium]